MSVYQLSIFTQRVWIISYQLSLKGCESRIFYPQAANSELPC